MSKFDPVHQEIDVLKQWEEQSTHKQANEKNAEGPQFFFLDGPPYTSGKVHLGTAWNKSLKDFIIRYKRMRGFKVLDRAGYDMHGLPVENATMKALGLKDNEDIEKFGKEKFIEECRKFCLNNMESMTKDFERLGVWQDFSNPYQSITKQFMSNQWALIKKAHEKGRLYEGLRTMPWCSISQSALAKHELEYKTVTDTSIFVKFPLKDDTNTSLVIWTTTPWTIPMNLAVMVNPEVDYLKVKVDSEFWIVAKALVGPFIQSVVGKQYEIIEEFKGDHMEGWKYVHPFYDKLTEVYDDIESEAPKTHTVLLSSEYVDTTAGSGLVHCAPGCGPEDYEVGRRNGLPAFNPVLENGVFPDSMGEFAGLKAKTNDVEFIKALHHTGNLVAKTKIEHEYPHDWRHHEPIIFRTTKQWFFKVEDMKDTLVAQNNDITWNPKAAYNAFNSWLSNLRDNSISKQRFWGTPLPIWRNTENFEDYIVVGSAQELEKLSGQKIDDLHIPSVDPIHISKDGKTYQRVPDVLDVWVDAGTAWWNTFDKPVEELTDIPTADFIIEGKDQVRGWFNLLHIAGNIMFDKPAFKAAYMHGYINDKGGRKMSKSLGNYITPAEIMDKYGADTFRFYAVGGANPGLDLNYNFEEIVLKYRNLGVIWNVHNYIQDLAKQLDVQQVDQHTLPDNLDIEEQYIVSKLHSSIQRSTQCLDDYQLNNVPQIIEDLHLDVSRVYIQFVRDKEDKNKVLQTLAYVFDKALKLLAPLCPFVSEAMYQNLSSIFVDTKASIHLESWPEVSENLIHADIEEAVGFAQSTIQALLAAREQAKINVRWPLGEAFVQVKEGQSQQFEQTKSIIQSHTNIKSIVPVEEITQLKFGIVPNFKELGKEFGQHTAQIATSLKSIGAEEQHILAKKLKDEKKALINVEGHDREIALHHVSISQHVDEPYFTSDHVVVDSTQSDELLSEGYMREVVRRIQQLRKEAGLEKNQAISFYYSADAEIQNAIEKFYNDIAQKCNITSKLENSDDAKWSTEARIKDSKYTIGMSLV